MRYTCHHGGHLVTHDGAARPPPCASVIVSLQNANDALTADLNECLGVVRASRAYVDDACAVLSAVPALLASVRRGLQGLMLLQHGVFLEAAGAAFRAWHTDRAECAARHSDALRAAHCAHQSHMAQLSAEHSAQYDAAQSDWRREAEELQRCLEDERAAAAERDRERETDKERERQRQREMERDRAMARERKRAEEEEEAEREAEEEARRALLRRAAAVVSQRAARGNGLSAAAQATPAVRAVAAQTESAGRRSSAAQTEAPRRAQGAKHSGGHSTAIRTVKEPCDTLTKEEGEGDKETDVAAMEKEMGRLRTEAEEARIEAAAAVERAAAVESIMQAQGEEIEFLRDALTRVEAQVGGGLTVASPLERLAMLTPQ